MKQTNTFFFFLIVFMYLVQCSQKNLVSFNQTAFKDEIATQENLSFKFNRAVVADSLLNIWDTTSYVNFSPKVEGKFKWISSNEVIFSPVKGFQPSTDYKASLNENLSRKLKEKTTIDKTAILNFHTAYLKLENGDVFWTQDERRSRQLRINLNFNYKVIPKSLQSIISLKTEGQNIPNVIVLNTENSHTAELLVEETAGMNLDDKNLELEIAPGIQCAESDFKTKQSISYKVQSPNKNRLSILQINPEFEEEKAQIRVKTNQSISREQVIDNLQISPKLIYEIQNLDYGFLIKANFKTGSTYTLKFSKKMQGVFGAALSEEYQQAVSFGAMNPFISFISKKGLYLSSKGNKNVGIRINNVPKVQVKIFKIYENNLLYFFKQHANDFYDNSYRSSFEEYGDIILDKEYLTKSLPLIDDFRVLNMDFENFNDTKGIYAVMVNSTENQWINSSKLISISDIGFMVKETREDILVFVNSILSATPMKGVKVNLLSQSNQSLARVETNEEGIAVFSNIKNKFPQAKVRLITAQQEKDFNYLYFNQSEVDQSSFETGGLSLNASGYQAFLYGERDLYRPGETVNLNVVIRDRNWKNPGKLPIKFKFKMPSGQDLSNLKGTLNDQGAFATSIKLPPNALTGTYIAEVYSSTDVLLKSMPISVEEFMPDRIKVKLQLTEEDYKTGLKRDLRSGDMAYALLSAVNLFGPPAANKNYQMNFSLVQKAFSPKNYPKHNFSINRSRREDEDVLSLTSNFTEGQTDEKGEAKESFKIPDEYEDMGLLQGNIYGTVFDETGRSISRSMYFNVFTQDVFLGVQGTEDYVSTNQALQISLIALNIKEIPLASRAKVKVIRYRWQTVLEKSTYGDLQYVSRRQDNILKEEEISINTTGAVFNFTPQVSGDYEIRVSLPNSANYVSSFFYAYSYGSTDNTSFEVNKDGKIEIKLDKDSYKIGEEAKVLFTTPFNGKMLVTLEKDKVLEYFYVNTENKSASKTFTIKAEYLPNVYITATLLKPLSDGAIPLTVAHGFQPLLAENPESKLNLSIEAVEKTESKQKQTIKVKTARAESDIEVTLAVVDEGILQLKNYDSPNPHDYFFQKRRLEVDSYDLYPQLFPEISLSKSSVGGGEGDLGARSSPMINNRVKLVRFWSGTLRTNAAGEVNYTIDIPQFSGSLRIMAVAYKDGTFGAAEKTIKVADPVVISTGLPRFLSPNDKVIVPVTLTNTTENQSSVNVQITTSDNLQVLGEKNLSANLKADNETQVEFEVLAKPVIDSAKIKVLVSAMGRTFSEELDVNIRPMTGLVKTAGSGTINGGAGKMIDFNNDLVPSTVKSRLIVSKSPLVQFSNNLEYLITYPYGCVEQVTSSVFPQLYVQDIMKAISPQKQNTDMYEAEIRENIQEGIMRLLSMQSYNGALSYWPDGGNTSWFGTAYALHFMIEAQKAGYEVNQGAMDRMYQYMKEEIANRKMEDYYYQDEKGKRIRKKIVPKEAIYSLYVLTLANQEDISTMNYYKENAQVLALDSKYLLASAFLILGDKVSYQQLIPSSFSGEISENAFGGSFHSYIRDEALALNALIEADAANLQVPSMAQHLSIQIKNAKYLNTQESSFALLALGKLSKQNEKSNVLAQITANNSNIANFMGNDLVLTQKLAGSRINIQASGQGSLFYFWQMQGLSATGKVKETDNKLKVRKTFYDQNGRMIKDNIFRQNDLIVVKVTLVAEPYFSNVENVVLTDMLPAGFEIENPRLNQSRAIRWIKNSDYPDYFDIRDDRINYFTTAGGKEKVFYYLARAVSKGTYQMGPASADAMYNGEYYSYYGAGTVKIVDRYARNN